jgi:hypothetical protein
MIAPGAACLAAGAADWTCLVPGAYARHVSMAELSRDGLERLLPAEGAGVGCVSPLHATSGRFQVMTTGR